MNAVTHPQSANATSPFLERVAHDDRTLFHRTPHSLTVCHQGNESAFATRCRRVPCNNRAVTRLARHLLEQRRHSPPTSDSTFRQPDLAPGKNSSFPTTVGGVHGPPTASIRCHSVCPSPRSQRHLRPAKDKDRRSPQRQAGLMHQRVFFRRQRRSPFRSVTRRQLVSVCQHENRDRRLRTLCPYSAEWTRCGAREDVPFRSIQLPRVCHQWVCRNSRPADSAGMKTLPPAEQHQTFAPEDRSTQKTVRPSRDTP